VELDNKRKIQEANDGGGPPQMTEKEKRIAELKKALLAP
jgi:hypothetical protein